MVKIRKEELEKAIDAFVKEIGVMLKAFDKEKEADVVEDIYNKKKKVMVEDTANYLEEVEHIEVL
ncbi:MAG: hypothetical protein ISS23_04120 [Nanoarchaeota archaeon]|nr:hypothetical protein [Nanoarchaeota archaeon]